MFLYVCVFMYNCLSGEDCCSVSDTDGSYKNSSTPRIGVERTYKVLVTSPDVLPLSYRRLVGAKATKLGSRDEHPAHC